VPTKAPVASNETTSTKRKVLEEPLEAWFRSEESDRLLHSHLGL
jgi:hypothetical protein